MVTTETGFTLLYVQHLAHPASLSASWQEQLKTVVDREPVKKILLFVVHPALNRRASEFALCFAEGRVSSEAPNVFREEVPEFPVRRH